MVGDEKITLEESAEASLRNGAIRLHRIESRMTPEETMRQRIYRSGGSRPPLNAEKTLTLWKQLVPRLQSGPPK